MICNVAVGTYSAADQLGIQILQLDLNSGQISFLIGINGVENPSFIAVDAPRQRLFAVSEKPVDGEIVSFQYDYTGGLLRELNRQKTRGNYPCYLNIDSTGRWLLGVNYMTGSVYVFPVSPDGYIESMTEFIQLEGKGVRPDRQEGPHPHGIFNIPGTNLWMVPDLGADRILVYRLSANGRLELQHVEFTQRGAGPRHLAVHPAKPIIYVIQELDSSVSVFSYDKKDGKLTRLQEDIRTVPDQFAGKNISADIHVSPSGLFLYASNRGHDSLAVFRIQQDGKIVFVTHCSTGKTPRNFMLTEDGRFILVANQDSDNVVLMECGENGIPVPTNNSYKVKQPVCLKNISS